MIAPEIAWEQVGHANNVKESHSNGYKLDIRLTNDKCATNYIKKTFLYDGERGDGAAKYKSAKGNTYALEGDHWDILYITGDE